MILQAIISTWPTWLILGLAVGLWRETQPRGYDGEPLPRVIFVPKDPA